MKLDRTAKRGLVLMLLHALLWVFAMFVADGLWGDAAAKWMAVAFVFANGAAGMWLTHLIVQANRDQTGANAD